MDDAPLVRKHTGDFHWEGVDVLRYKQDGEAPFKDVTRQVLFESAALPVQLRYFEVAPGGHTTLERHEHVHAVMVIRGRGQCLVGERAYAIGEQDLVSVPPMTWHQFRAEADAPLGFLCLVATERDRPQMPTSDEAKQLQQVLDKL
jgi:mannose-6-phosphate isomerase-like protein (cupin superfamily)